MSRRVRPASVRPGSGTARLLEAIPDRGDGSISPGMIPGMAPASAARCARRAVSSGLIRPGPPPSLTLLGRWCRTALRLGLSVSELAAVSSVYVQMAAWESDGRLRESGAARFAIRDVSILSSLGYRDSSIRDVYRRLAARGLIRRVANGGLVGMDAEIIKRLRPYGADLGEIYRWLREGRRVASG